MRVNLTESRKSFVLPAILFPALFLLTVAKMIDTDLWFHMKAGQVITETGMFIYRDIFSYTAAGREWLYHEWLFGVISYHVYSIFGVNGLIIGKAILLSLAFIFIYKDMRLRGVNPYLASFILFIAVSAARFRFTERPHIFKFLFVAAFIYILDLYRLKGKNRLWLLPVIQLLWTNIHGSFILGPVIIAIYLFSEAISGTRREIKALTVILLLASLTTIINPYGFKLIYFSLGFREKSVLSSISEWEPTKLKDLYGAFGLLFITGLTSFFLRYRKVKLVDLLVFGLFMYLSSKAIRFTALFSLATAPIIADNVHYLSSGLTYTRNKKGILWLLSIGVIVFLLIHEVRGNPILVFGLGQGRAFPQKAIEFLKHHPIDGNMYNSYAFGGYLIWGYPERKVFVDGRAEVYDREFQEAFIRAAYIRLWFKALDRYDINYAIIAYSSLETDSFAELISNDPNWVLIYWDDVARIYVRNNLRNSAIIDSFGHRVITNPFKFSHDSLKRAVINGLAYNLETELKTDIESNPKNARAHYWLGLLFYETGRKDDAVRTWEDSARIKPDADTYSSIGNVFAEKGLYTKAIEYYGKAIETNKSFALAYYNLGSAYEAIGDGKEAAGYYKKFIKYAGPEYADVVKGLKERGIE